MKLFKLNCKNKKNNAIRFIIIFVFILIGIGIINQASLIANNNNNLQVKGNANGSDSISESKLEKTLEDLTSKEESTDYPVYKEVNSGELIKINYIDVGQGDSIFIELPNDETMLIDAGEYNKLNLIINFIKKLGYSKIDYLVGTHPHADHIGGMSAIINTFEIGRIYLPRAIATSETYEKLLTTIANNNLNVMTAKSGVNIFNKDNLNISIIAPNNNSYSNLNNYSAVIKITYGKRNFLFMGDAEIESENEIVSSVSADVIKIGHHGSNTASSQKFIDKVKAKYAIISVGTNNKYNHPYSSVISNWENSGAKIYRTDQDGNILVISNGTSLSISSDKRTIIEDITIANNEKIDDNSNTTLVESNVLLPNATSIEENDSSSKNGITLKSITSPIGRGHDATISIIGNPNTEYSISVIYDSGPSKSKGLENKISDINGNVLWTWQIGTRTKVGTYNINISGGGNTETYQINITE